jgi:hypothetical protein
VKRTALKRSAPMKRRTALRSVNRARQDKRKAEYRKYLASPQWKALREKALKRAGGQCEFVTIWTAGGTTSEDRCEEVERLEVHHTRYAKTLGEEPMTWLVVLCRGHHRFMESMKWWRKP